MPHTSRHVLTAIILASSVTGCSYVPPRDTSSTFFSPPAGSELVLTKSITIPARGSWVYIQDGKVINRLWDVDTYYGNCQFEMDFPADVARTIEPDTFTVTRTIRHDEDVRLWGPAIVASVGDGGDPIVNYKVTMLLHSERQPGVSNMTCQNWDTGNDGQQLSIDQIRKTLGDLFTLKLATN